MAPVQPSDGALHAAGSIPTTNRPAASAAADVPARSWISVFIASESIAPGQLRKKLEQVERAAAALLAAYGDAANEPAQSLRYAWLFETQPLSRILPERATDLAEIDAAAKAGFDQLANFETILAALPRLARTLLDDPRRLYLQPLTPGKRHQVHWPTVMGTRALGHLFKELTGDEPMVGGGGTRTGPGSKFKRFVEMVAPLIGLEELRGRKVRTYLDHARAADQGAQADHDPLPIEALHAD